MLLDWSLLFDCSDQQGKDCSEGLGFVNQLQTHHEVRVKLILLEELEGGGLSLHCESMRRSSKDLIFQPPYYYYNDYY